MYINPWMYKNEIYDGPICKAIEGFVYIITNLQNGRRYIGKKHFWQRQKEKGAQRKTTKESPWRNYYGSCEELTKDVLLLGKENFKREILHICMCKKQMSFMEEKEQWTRDVLRTDDYYNTNIAGRFFVRERKIYYITYEETIKEVCSKNDKFREIKSEQWKGDKNIAKRLDVRKKISEKKSGENHHQWGKPISEEHKLALHTASRKAKRRKITDKNGNVYESGSDYMKKTKTYTVKFYKLLEAGEITRE